MKRHDINKKDANLSLSYEEIYIILQCVAEMRDTRTDPDIESITGVNRNQIAAISKELNEIKNAMFDANQ